MTTLILGLLAETFIHSGTGQNEGAIDLPVAREAATDYPFLPGSGFKGALRDHAREFWNTDDDKQKITRCFGHEGQENAGGVLVSDARLLLLPVRSLTGAYRWVTCPHIIERWRRDLERMGTDDQRLPPIPEMPDEGRYHGNGNGVLYLEEHRFSHACDVDEQLAGAIKPMIRHERTRARLHGQMVILNDKDFAWFARYALAIQARNVLEKDSKKSKNLWYEESLPPDTLMYALLGKRCRDSGIGDLQQLLKDNPYFQAGGNETVGQGWFAVSIVEAGQ